ncbi:MAG: MBL fold metallo-hydrolase [Actinomycetia bacterium]|nr:MBL fold metallo-hydrolase [Actinomycetes bacterium]
MDVLTFRTPGLGDQTYLLVHEGQGVLVDPQRDIDRFLDATAEQDVELRFVLDTHLHNDYVSGAEQAARTTGAQLVLPAAAAPAYPSMPAFHLEDIPGGALTIRPIHTPGHTPEHTSYLVLVEGEPAALFSGGSLLVASAGRPDLLGEERARTMATLQHQSLHRLAELPESLELFPTHGQGSFCTASGAGRYTSTVGQERRENPLLAIPTVEEFVDQLLGSAMPIPAFYKFMGPTNTLGVPAMPDHDVPEMSVDDIAAQPDGTRVVDVRPRAEQAAGILPGSLAIEVSTDFGSWAGWLVPRTSPIMLVAGPDQDITEPVVQLAQIGVDSVVGVVRDLPADRASVGFELVDIDRFRALMAEPDAQVLDVRMPSEWAAASIEGSIRRFLPDLLTDGVPAELDADRPVLIACRTGRRASIAAGVLANAGYRAVVLDEVGVPDVVDQAAADAA